MKRFSLILSLLFFFLSGCQTMSPTPGETVTRYYQDGKFNGSILIAQNNQVIIDTVFGYRDFGNKEILTKKLLSILLR